MSEVSSEAIKSLIREAISHEISEPVALHEAAEDPLKDVTRVINLLASLVDGRSPKGEAGARLEALAKRAASALVTAGYGITANDLKAVKRDEGFQYAITVRDPVTKEETLIERDHTSLPSNAVPSALLRPIDLKSELRARLGSDFAKISERRGGGIYIKSTGEIWDECLKEAMQERDDVAFASRLPIAMQNFADLLAAKISSVAIVLNVLGRIEERLLVINAVESAEASIAASGMDVTEQERVRIIRSAVYKAEQTAQSVSLALSTAKDALSSYNGRIIAATEGMLASVGIVTTAIGYESGLTQEEVRARLEKSGNNRAIANLNAILFYGEREENVKNGPMYIPILLVFNDILRDQGLSLKRGLEGKGITRNEIEDKKIKINDFRNMTAEDIAAVDSLRLDSLVDIVEERSSGAEQSVRRDVQSALDLVMGKKAAKGEGITTVPGAIGASLEAEAARIAELERAGGGPSASMSAVDVTRNLAQKIMIEKMQPSLSRVTAALRAAPKPPTPPPTTLKDSVWQAAAYNAFIRPLASSLSRSKFADTSALENLTTYNSASVEDAATDRMSAGSLKLMGPASQRRGASGDVGDNTLELLLALTVRERADELESFLGTESDVSAEEEEIEGGAGTKKRRGPKKIDTATHLTSLEGVRDALKMARSSFERALKDPLQDRVASLKSIVSTAKRLPKAIAAIRETYSGIGGQMGDLIDDLAAGREIRNPYTYIVGTALEPIREADVESVSSVVAHVGAASRSGPASTAEYAGLEGGESRGAAGASPMSQEDVRAREEAIRSATERAAAERAYAAEEEGLAAAEEEERARQALKAKKQPQTLLPRVGRPDFGDLDESRLLESLRLALARRAGRSLTEASSVLDPLGAKEFASTPIGALGLTKTGRQVKTRYGEAFEEDGGEYNLAVFVNDTLRPLVKSLRAEKQPNQALIDAYDSLGAFISAAAKDDTGANSKQLLSAAQSASGKWLAISKEMTSADKSADGLMGNAAQVFFGRIESDYDLSRAHPLTKFAMSRNSMTRDKFKTEFEQVREFYKRAAERLKAGKPVFDFAQYNKESDSTPTTQDLVSPTMDDGWKKYIAADPDKRTPVWNAWVARQRVIAGTPNDVDLAFSSFVMWWKSNSSARRFSDGSKGGYAATIDLLNREAQASKMSAPKQQTAQRQANA
jgi:hypothetical protein